MKLFLLLKETSLTFFLKDSTPKELTFPETGVRHQEIIDQKLFEEFLRSALANIPKEEISIFLSNELVFSKGITIDNTTDLDQELNKFLDLVPLSPMVIEKKVIQKKDAALFLATNGNLYKTITAIVEEKGAHIKNVVPLKIFGEVPQDKSITYDFLSSLEKERNAVQQVNFLTIEKPKETKGKAPTKQIAMLITCIIIFALVLAWAVINLKLLPSQKSPIKTIPTPSKPAPSIRPTATISITPPASSSAIKKENITIQVLNGSGVAGQAGKIKDQLNQLGFTNIQTGNADGPTSNQTIVVFSDKVGKSSQQEILSELKKTFSSIETQQLSTPTKYDVSITTGEVK